MKDLSGLHFCVDCRFYRGLYDPYGVGGSWEECTAIQVTKWNYRNAHTETPSRPYVKNCDNDCVDYEPRLLKRLANIWRKAVK